MIVPGDMHVVEALAEILHDKMEHLDPTDGTPWADLNEKKKNFTDGALGRWVSILHY
jgi:hypothetical protein